MASASQGLTAAQQETTATWASSWLLPFPGHKPHRTPLLIPGWRGSQRLCLHLLRESHVSAWASQVALMVKSLSASAGDTRDLSSIPGLERSPDIGNGNPLQYCCLGNPMNRGAWQAIVHGISRTGQDLLITPPPSLWI